MEKLGILELILILFIVAGPIIAVIFAVTYQARKKKKYNQKYGDTSKK